MTRSKPITFLAGAAALPLIALAVAGCGGSNDDNNASANNPTTPTTSAVSSGGSATVDVASAGDLGSVLVDSQGRTIYLFGKDTGTTSTCTGACASAWPPVRANGTPTAGSGANASMIGTTPRSDGKPQVTYNGHPLYLFSMDQNPGDTNGEGLTAFGGSWFAVSPAGNQVTGAASSSGSSTSSSGTSTSSGGTSTSSGGGFGY
jgi:predicted lipoprotein with Yx(FWY)xxD motif